MINEFVKIIDGAVAEYPLSVATWQTAVEAGFLGMNSTPEQQAELGIFPVAIPQNAIDDEYMYVTTEPTLIDGVWTTSWTKDLSTPEEFKATRRMYAEQRVRHNRDALIAQTVWRVERYTRIARLGGTQVDDIAVLDAYLQALADVPTQQGFPFNIVWPVLN